MGEGAAGPRGSGRPAGLRRTGSPLSPRQTRHGRSPRALPESGGDTARPRKGPLGAPCSRRKQILRCLSTATSVGGPRPRRSPSAAGAGGRCPRGRPRPPPAPTTRTDARSPLGEGTVRQRGRRSCGATGEAGQPGGGVQGLRARRARLTRGQSLRMRPPPVVRDVAARTLTLGSGGLEAGEKNSSSSCLHFRC